MVMMSSQRRSKIWGPNGKFKFMHFKGIGNIVINVLIILILFRIVRNIFNRVADSMEERNAIATAGKSGAKSTVLMRRVPTNTSYAHRRKFAAVNTSQPESVRIPKRVYAA